MTRLSPLPGRWEVLQGLSQRVLGDALGGSVRWHQCPPSPAGERAYTFSAAAGQVTLGGSDVLAAATALHEYLKLAHRRRVSWDTDLPLRLDDVEPDQLTGSGVGQPAVYYLNFCTFGYTSTFWDWDRWQREIDWMALHGVTMPLALTGHEAVLAHVYREIGLGDDEIMRFIGGPSYLPWQFMGCLDNWGTPMSRRLLEERRELGTRIIERQMSYGMTPVLPAFVGHVPASLARHDTTQRDWWGFTTHLLDPADERFEDLIRSVVIAQGEMFGTANLYAADPFIEMEPPANDPGYLDAIAQTIVRGLRAGDAKAMWVMQAWTFAYLDWWNDQRIASFLDSIPDDALMMLDLWGEMAPQWRRLDGFRGKPWIWCALHNFGGRSDIFGALDTIERELDAARSCSEPPVGIGLAMEATEQNHACYELVLEPDRPNDLSAWVADLAAQRYGLGDNRVSDAWRRLLATVYAAPPERLLPTERPTAVTLRPDVDELLDHERLARRVDAWSWYDTDSLTIAARLLFDVAVDHPTALAGELGHDLISVMATVAQNAANRLLADVVAAWHSSGPEYSALSEQLLELLSMLDAVLAIRPELRLATWESAALAASPDPAEQRSLLDDARRLLSIWNRSEPAPLTDYSSRLWSGLVGGLYRPRWQAWLDVLSDARRSDSTPDAGDLDARIEAVTLAFISDEQHSQPAPVSEPLVLMRRLIDASAAALDRKPPVTTPHPPDDRTPS